jgi:rod shape-determining protein MreB
LAAIGLQPVIESIAHTAESFFKELPDGLACDIIDNGICLTGGGALIPGVKVYLEHHLGISLKVAGNPLASVAEGARAILPMILSLDEWQSFACRSAAFSPASH